MSGLSNVFKISFLTNPQKWPSLPSIVNRSRKVTTVKLSFFFLFHIFFPPLNFISSEHICFFFFFRSANCNRGDGKMELDAWSWDSGWGDRSHPCVLCLDLQPPHNSRPGPLPSSTKQMFSPHLSRRGEKEIKAGRRKKKSQTIY